MFFLCNDRCSAPEGMESKQSDGLSQSSPTYRHPLFLIISLFEKNFLKQKNEE